MRFRLAEVSEGGRRRRRSLKGGEAKFLVS